MFRFQLIINGKHSNSVLLITRIGIIDVGFVVGIGLSPEALHEDLLPLPDLRTVDPRLGHRPGVHLGQPRALELVGMAASGAKYGIATCHFYWVGAIPAMVFLAVFMMPFYYGSKARSVPEYLKMRFDERVVR